MRRPHAEEFILPTAALLALAVDQISKGLVVARVGLGQSVELASWLAPVFQITHITNTGVAFGLLPGMSDLFVVIALVVVAILLFYYRQLPRGQWLVRAALGLQLGGALGNLLDRLIRGSVVDFVDVNFWPLREWPVFNVADASIVAGVVFLGISLLREGVVQQRPDEREETIAEKGAL